MLDLPALDAIKRGLVRTFDPESRKKAASERFSKRLSETKRLESANLLERMKRREIIESDSPSITGIIKSRARETGRNMKIRRIENINRDAFADNFSRPSLAKAGRKVQRGVQKARDIGIGIELAGIEARQSVRRFERDSGFDMGMDDDMFKIDVDSMISSGPVRKAKSRARYEPVYNQRGKRIGSRKVAKKSKRQSSDPWDIPIDLGF